jgi:hypothetical protein
MQVGVSTTAGSTAQDEKIQEHQKMLSQAYGDRRGWVRSPARFSIEKLPRMNVAGEDWNIAYTDHRSFWQINGEPFAVVAHL